MMLGFVAAVAFALLAVEPAEALVEYTLTPYVGAAGLDRVEVQLSFRGDADGETELELPDRWAGVSGLHSALRDLSVVGGAMSDTQDPARRPIAHALAAPLIVRYSVGLSAADPGLDYEKARPVLRPSWFYIHGEGAFAAPAGRGEAPARFRWGQTPNGWRMASNLDGPAGAAISVDEAVQGIFIGGTDLRLIERQVGGHPLRVAVRGEWTFEAEALADALARVIEAENAYMASGAMPFFVSLIPQTGGETGALSTGGTGKYGHRWFGRSLGPSADPEAEEYWFTEGFNDFVAAQSLVAAGLWSAQDYAEGLNEVLRRYGQSPARGRANAATAAAFWQDPAAQQMLYDRGHLFALLLAAEARGTPHLREALARMTREAASFPAQETQAARFARAFDAIPAQRLAALTERAIIGGEPIELPPDLFASCGAIRWVEQPVYAPGYTAEDRADGRFFATVEEGNPAWVAGLRPGMRYVRRVSFRHGDSTVPIVMRVADGSGERVLTWLPQARETARFQRLELRELSATEAAACRSQLAGG